MKGLVVLDKAGKIVSLGYGERFESVADDELVTRGGPVAEAGQTVVELHMPDEYRHMPLVELMERVQAEAKLPARKTVKK